MRRPVGRNAGKDGKRIGSEAICPGTFDPITNGHIDIIKRASRIFNKVIVSVVENPSKEALFSYPERLNLVQETTGSLKGVKVIGFSGLVVDLARACRVKVIVRGLRMISDFEYEFQMALTNRNLAPELETIFFMPHPQYSYISSRLIKEAVFLGADVSQFVPSAVFRALKKKMTLNRQTN